MSKIDSAVAFTLRDDDGADETLWLGFTGFEGVQETLARGLSASAETRAETVANIVEEVFDDMPAKKGLSFAQPPGVTHTVHTFDFNTEKVVLSDPDTGNVKVAFPFAKFLERNGF